MFRGYHHRQARSFGERCNNAATGIIWAWQVDMKNVRVRFAQPAQQPVATKPPDDIYLPFP
jgi:hypothetical protein